MPDSHSIEPETAKKRQQLIQHSNPISEDTVSESSSSDWSPPRPTRLAFDVAEEISEEHDPTTVLLVPQAAAPWSAYELEEEEEEEEEDLILSPRLFGPRGRFEPLEDRNDDIFRQYEEGEEDFREGNFFRQSSWSPSMRHDDTESRM